MWNVWTGGNDRLWDVLSRESLGSLDFLKTLSSHPTLPYSRDTRWNYLGLVNEPCFKKATGPDPNRYGLWLDVRDPGCGPDPFANADKYKGVQIGARGRTVPVGSYYGEPTGIVGLRLFPNPDFDEEARKKWDSERYYRDPSYYESRNLVKPYRVGMSCAFCHVGPNPVKPPADPENPRWENLSSNVGAQYFWWDRVFDWKSHHEREELLLPVAAHLAAGHARHLARLDRQHQQPADHERGLLPRSADGAGQALGKGDDRRRRPRQQAVQRVRAGVRPARRSSSPRRPRPGRRACSRTAPIRSARSARSIAST